MDKITIVMFPAITLAIITAGIILFEIGKYVNGLF